MIPESQRGNLYKRSVNEIRYDFVQSVEEVESVHSAMGSAARI